MNSFIELELLTSLFSYKLPNCIYLGDVWLILPWMNFCELKKRLTFINFVICSVEYVHMLKSWIIFMRRTYKSWYTMHDENIYAH